MYQPKNTSGSKDRVHRGLRHPRRDVASVKTRVQKIAESRKISSDRALSPSFNGIIVVRAGVPDKRGRLERLPTLFSQPITVTNAKGSPWRRLEKHTWGVAARSPFLFPPFLTFAVPLSTPRATLSAAFPPFRQPVSLSLSFPPPRSRTPLFRRYPRPLTSFAASRKRRKISVRVAALGGPYLEGRCYCRGVRVRL